MENTFRNRIQREQEQFIQDCFNTIWACCSTQAHGHLHFNHFDYVFMSKNEDDKFVPFVHQHGEDIEMYSYDGWMDLADLGHWVDICIDIVLSITAGCAGQYGYEETNESAKLKEM